MVKGRFDSSPRLWLPKGGLFYVLLFADMTKAFIAAIALTVGCINPASAQSAYAQSECDQRVRNGQIRLESQYQSCLRNADALLGPLFGSFEEGFNRGLRGN